MRGGYFVKLDHDPQLHRDYCIFRCGNGARPSRTARPTLRVEMNVGRSGRFLASANDEDSVVRVAGVAHPECFEAWQAIAYGVPIPPPLPASPPAPAMGWRSQARSLWRRLTPVDARPVT